MRPIALDASVVPVNFMPSEEQELVQNVRTILRTQAGDVPLDREFGIDPLLVDSGATPRGKARLNSEISRKISRYEPRVRVSKIVYSGAPAGVVNPSVHLELTP